MAFTDGSLDEKLAQLMSVFDNVSVQDLQNYLKKYKTVDQTIDFLLRKDCLENRRNAFDLLSNKECTSKKIKLTADNISKYLPAVMEERFLDDDLANALLLDMMEESKEWNIRQFSLFGKSNQTQV